LESDALTTAPLALSVEYIKVHILICEEQMGNT
jgi:hypothetical protein